MRRPLWSGWFKRALDEMDETTPMPASNKDLEKALFEVALNLQEGEVREAFLIQACQNAPALRARIEELLSAYAVADDFLEATLLGGKADQRDEAESIPETDASDLATGVDTRIGRYRVLERLGEGGCGVVYLAEQLEPVQRRVALKIIRLGMESQRIIARFEQERQALARMDHPNIARVIDAGATVSGRPYFVMELVEGEPITGFCDACCLGIRQRLELFVQVCLAIEHAHQKGVIHRDVKPSNVLVRLQDEVPMPKVIDFGIAKATAEIMARDATHTQFDQFLGTPAYMSPEQAQGGPDVDTRSDIYSLGVLLYELLSGRTPFDFAGLPEGAVEEFRRIIREEEPELPSVAVRKSASEGKPDVWANRATDPQRLIAQLAGDLDWIVMKALAKECPRRYQTATGLAADVQRYLKDEVVLARPPSRMYRLGKLVRRNKRVFIAGGIAVFGLFSGFGVSTWMYFRERDARQEQARLRESAERLREKAEIREQVAHAAVRMKYGDLAGADKLLATVPIEETPSSLESSKAFGAVAYWHIQAGRLDEAASRYSSMARAITSVDDSDLPEVSVNLLPAAAAVAYAGDMRAYEEIRHLAIERFGSTSNGVVAEQTLKTCILFPPDERMIQSLRPLAGIIERDIENKKGLIGTKFYYTAWACFAMSLWNYRLERFSEAERWAERCLAFPKDNEARIASILIVRAMIEWKSGQAGNARASMAAGGDEVRKILVNKTWVNPKSPSLWFEWLHAILLFSEAERVLADG
jgi:serine/threonine protein kinase